MWGSARAFRILLKRIKLDAFIRVSFYIFKRIFDYGNDAGSSRSWGAAWGGDRRKGGWSASLLGIPPEAGDNDYDYDNDYDPGFFIHILILPQKQVTQDVDNLAEKIRPIKSGCRCRRTAGLSA